MVSRDEIAIALQRLGALGFWGDGGSQVGVSRPEQPSLWERNEIFVDGSQHLEWLRIGASNEFQGADDGNEQTRNGQSMTFPTQGPSQSISLETG